MVKLGIIHWVLDRILIAIEARRNKRIDSTFNLTEGGNDRGIKIIGCRELTNKRFSNESQRWWKEHEALIRNSEEKLNNWVDEQMRNWIAG